MLDDAGRVVREDVGVSSSAPGIGSDAPTARPHTNINGNTTSEADALGGTGNSLIWGTTVSIDDTFASFKDFLRNFTLKYRLWGQGLTEAETAMDPTASSKPYWEAMENMLLLGTTRLYLDIGDLRLYPRTVKLWHQIQAYPQEIVPIMDQSVHDLMMELARAEMVKQRASQSQQSHGARPTNTQRSIGQSSDVPVAPSSELGGSEEQRPHGRAQQDVPNLEDQVADSVYVVRPFGLDTTVNLRDLNPSGECKSLRLRVKRG